MCVCVLFESEQGTEETFGIDGPQAGTIRNKMSVAVMEMSVKKKLNASNISFAIRVPSCVACVTA